MSTPKKRESPLAGSALFNSVPPPQLPTVSEPIQPLPSVPQTQREPSVQEPPLLYNTPPSAEWVARPFDRQYDKQAINANPYLVGAIEALGKLLKLTKTEMYEEMMADYIKKHESVLEGHSDLVRLMEEKYRKKHNL